MPRFGLRVAGGIGGRLAEMGMPLAFGPEAGFSGVAGPAGVLALAGVDHATDLGVHEEGLEAARRSP